MKISEIITSERGRIVPGVNTTKDVKPDQLKRQCAKLGMKCNKDGVPDDIFEGPLALFWPHLDDKIKHWFRGNPDYIAAIRDYYEYKKDPRWKGRTDDNIAKEVASVYREVEPRELMRAIKTLTDTSLQAIYKKKVSGSG